MKQFPFKHVLIAGGLGMLGQSLSSALSKIEGVKVSVLDRPSQSYRAGHKFKFDFYPVDLTQTFWQESVIAQLGDVDCLVNMAAMVGRREGEADPENTLTNNATLMLRLLGLAEQLPRKPFFVHISSVAVYGHCGLLGVAPGREGPIGSEATARMRADSAYGASKAIQEELFTWFRDTGRAHGITIVPDALFGPGQPAGRFFPSVVEKLLTRQKITVTGQYVGPHNEFQSDRTGWMHVDDCSEAICRILQCASLQTAGFGMWSRWHVAGRHNLDQIETVFLIAKSLGLTDNVDLVEVEPPGKSPRFHNMDLARLSQIYQPPNSLPQIRDYVRQYASSRLLLNPQWAPSLPEAAKDILLPLPM